MNKLFIKLVSCFIFDKQKRHLFRQKHDEIGNLKNEIKDLSDKLNEISIPVRDTLSKRRALRSRLIKDEAEYFDDVRKLKANLEPEALAHLEFILKTINLGDIRKNVLLNEVYDAGQMEKLFADRNLQKEIKRIDDYYQWKHYKLPVNYFTPEVFIHKYGLDALKTKINKNSAIIDVGALFLDTALIFREYFPNNKIIAFEPSKESYELGLRTQKLNNLQNIDFINMGLGDKNEESYLCVDSANYKGFWGGGNHIAGNKQHFEEKEVIKLCTLDSYVQKHNLSIGLIKTDVEGFEPQVISGALNTIKTQKPILLISIYHNYNDFYKIKPYLESLDLGYKFDFFVGKYEKTNMDIILIGEAY